MISGSPIDAVGGVAVSSTESSRTGLLSSASSMRSGSGDALSDFVVLLSTLM